MGINVSKGNMYDFVTHTWNTVKGECPHGCTYCYMRRFGKQRPARFDAREMKADLGEDNFIFVGSSCDLFSEAIPEDWIVQTIMHMDSFDNQYLFQSKNPKRMADFWSFLPRALRVSFCTTIETNRYMPEIMGASPEPEHRARAMSNLLDESRYVTIEPIMDFDLEPMVELIKRCEPVQVNIGADSGCNHLPEPPAEKVLALIEELNKFTTVARKTNLGRILEG